MHWKCRLLLLASCAHRAYWNGDLWTCPMWMHVVCHQPKYGHVFDVFFLFFVLSSVFIDGVRKYAVRSLSAGPTKRSCEGTQRSSRNCTLIMRCVTSNTSYTTMRLPRNIFLFINALAIKCPAACTATANLKLVHMKKSDFNPFEMFIYAKFMAAINFNDMPFTPGRFTTCFDRVLYNKIFFFFFVFLSMLYPILRFVCAHGEFLYAIDVRQIPV